MTYENPYSLLSRLRLGREEFCQRLLTSLILGGPYPRWNTRSVPTAQGVAFLKSLDKLSFGDSRWASDAVFVDELDLPRRHDNERGGAPDQAVLWPGRIWFIEHKTEPGSHRHDQLPSYYDLGGHYYPEVPIDITYLTPAMTVAAPTVTGPNRYAHVTWSSCAALIAQTWADTADADEATVRDVLLETIDSLATKPSVWRAQLADKMPHAVLPLPVLAAPPVQTGSPDDTVLVAEADALTAALDLARLTADDGRQRGLDVEFASLEELQALRLDVRRGICTGADDRLRHVMPWLWSVASTGRPLTAAGASCGYELRLSRYAKPRC